MKLAKITFNLNTNATMTSPQLEKLCENIDKMQDKLESYAIQLAKELGPYDVRVAVE